MTQSQFTGASQEGSAKLPSGIESRQTRFNFATIGIIFCFITSWPLAVFMLKKYNGESYSKKFDLQISDYNKNLNQEKNDATNGDTKIVESDQYLPDTKQNEIKDNTKCEFIYTNGNVSVKREGDICITIRCNRSNCSFNDYGLKKEQEVQDVNSDVVAADPSILDIKPQYMFWFWAAVASTACTFSVLGLFSSVIFRKRNAEIFLDSKTDIAVLFFLSIVSGILLLSLVVGGYISGTLFPSVSGGIESYGFNSWVSLKFRGPDWGKLAVWSYISGFYERIIPSMMDKIVQGSEKQQTK